MTGRQVPFLAVIVPLVLLGLLDGRRGLREAWPAAVVAGLSFGIAQFLMANYGPAQLVDIVASLVSAGAVLLLVRAWKPANSSRAVSGSGESGLAVATGGGPGTAEATGKDPKVEMARAFAPYLVVIVFFAVVAVPSVATALGSVTRSFRWSGLHVLTSAGQPLSLATFKFDWLVNSGTVLLAAGLLTTVLLGLNAGDAVRCYGQTLRQLGGAIRTVVGVLGTAYVLNLSGQTATLGQFLARAGSLFALLSPVLGWFGTAVTGSDTSSNSLFGLLQVVPRNTPGCRRC